MAIQIPQFQVAAISPGSLAQNRYNDFGDRLIAQALGYAIDRKLAEHQATLNLENSKVMAGVNSDYRKREEFEGNVRTGSLIPAPSSDFYLPGEAPISPIKGIGDFQGQQFVPAASVAALQHERYLNSPVPVLGDRPAIPGTRVRDTINSEGEPLPIEQLNRFRLGNPEAMANQIAALPGGASSPVGRSLQARFEGYTADGAFTVEEERALEQEMTTEKRTTLMQTLFTMENTTEDRRAAIARARRANRESLQIWDPQLEARRDLTPYEVDVLTLAESTAAGSLSDEQLGEAKYIQQYTMPRIGAPDIVAGLRERVTQASLEGEEVNQEFAAWLQGKYNTSSEAVKESIREDMANSGITTLGYNTFQEFGASPNSAGYRQFWALWSDGYSTAADILPLTKELALPFGLQGVWRVGERLYPGRFNPTGEMAPAAGGLAPIRTPSIEGEDAAYSDAMDAIEAMEGALSNSAVRATDLRAALNSSDPGVIRDNLTAIRDGLRHSGSMDDTIVADALDDMLSSFQDPYYLSVFQRAFFNAYPRAGGGG